MIDISSVKVGDRVRLTRTNGDGSEETAEFTVRAVWNSRLYGETNVYVAEEWDRLDPLKPPIPTRPGTYTPYTTTNPDTQILWCLLADGTWLRLPRWEGSTVTRIDLASVEQFHNQGTLRYIELGVPQ